MKTRNNSLLDTVMMLVVIVCGFITCYHLWKLLFAVITHFLYLHL